MPVRWSYLPASPQGWALYIPYSLYLIATFLWVYQHDKTPYGIVFGVMVYWVIGLVVMQWIASHKS